MVSGSLSPFYSKCFSPFPHGTSSLSVSEEYLALEDGPPIFRQDFSCPALLVIIILSISLTGLSPPTVYLSRYFCYQYYNFRALPLSLATTHGISIDFFSSRYLDVSVPWVCLLYSMTGLYPPGCPIRTSTDQTVVCTFP
jgi:hypothetical protein